MQGRSIFPTLCALLAMLLLALSDGHAQELPAPDTNRMSLALHGGYSLLSHNGAFAVDGNGDLVSTTDCGQFTSGRGNGWIARLSLGLPLAQGVRIVLAPAFEHHRGTLRYTCVDPAQIRLPDGSLVPALTEFVADIAYDEASMSAAVEYRPMNIPLRMTVGPSLSTAFGSSYDVREEIVAPSSAEFVSGGQQRRFGNKTFPAFESPSLALEGAISYAASIGHHLALVPEIRYRYRLTDEVSWAHLRTHALFGMLGMEYTFQPTQPPPPAIAQHVEPRIEPEPVEPIRPPSPPLAVSIAAVAIDRQDATSDTATLHVRRMIRTEFHPLLPYLFFDAGSARIPDRYRLIDSTGAKQFTERDLKGKDRLQVYHDLLNIVGLRMQKIPGATLMLTGTEPEATKGSVLAQQRAESIKTYLTTVWGIAPSRISITTRRDPAAATNSISEEGASENRRVEIVANIPTVTDPVILDDTVTVADWSQLVIQPEIRGGEGLGSWEVAANIGSATVSLAHGIDAPPTRIPIALDSVEEFSKLDRGADIASMKIRLTARDNEGAEKSATTTVPVNRVTTETLSRENGYYSLILFDFGSANLRPEHLRIVDLINQRTAPGTQLSVTGYTDRLGEEGTNFQLSTRRAEAVAEHLTGRVIRTDGLGSSVQLYDNSLPEGRFYCRSVTIQTTN